MKTFTTRKHLRKWISRTKKKEKIKMREYIIPYQDSGIGNKINLKVVGAICWIIMLLLKIICEDKAWTFFLMFSVLLLLFIIPFFITKEVIFEAENSSVVVTDVTEIESSSSSLELPSPPYSSSSSSDPSDEAIPFIMVEAIENRGQTDDEPKHKKTVNKILFKKEEDSDGNSADDKRDTESKNKKTVILSMV